MLRAILLDLDGTLIDSYRDIGIHLNATLRDFGLQDVDVESVRYMVGGGARELLRRFFEDRLEQALRVFRNYYMQRPVIHTKPFDGVLEVLEELKSRGIGLAVITNKMEELSKRILRELRMDGYFEVVVGGDTFEEKKPSPLPVLKTLEFLGIAPEHALMVGDTDADITAGRLAGTRTALAKWGYVRLNGTQPDYFLEEPRELFKIEYFREV